MFNNQDLTRQVKVGTRSPHRKVHAIDEGPTPSSAPRWTPKPKPDGEVKRVPLNNEDPSKQASVGGGLTPEAEWSLLELLHKNADVFA